jgi:hypothetical protein
MKWIRVKESGYLSIQPLDKTTSVKIEYSTNGSNGLSSKSMQVAMGSSLICSEKQNTDSEYGENLSSFNFNH